MGTRFEIPVTESAKSQAVILNGQLPTAAPNPGQFALFVGDNVLTDPTSSHLVIVAIEQALAAAKEVLTAEGQQAPQDAFNVRDPLDPYKQVSSDITLATEAHIWFGYTGTVLESSSSQFMFGAFEKLISEYKEHIGVGNFTQIYGTPAGAITVATGTYASAATFNLSGTKLWERGTIIDLAGTTDAGVFGLNIALPKDMVIQEVALLLAEFLKGWSQATFKNVRHPSNPLIVTIGMLAFAGGLTVSFDSLTITPVP